MEQEDAMFTEDAVDALLERLVDPLLHDLSKAQFPQDGEEPIARQLAALAWIYYYYLRRWFPSLSYWDTTELCRKAVVLRANLAHYHDVKAQTSLARTKVLKACTAAQEANGLTPCVARVAVLLLCSSQKQCLIVRSLITKSVWSLVETEVEGTSNLLDYALSAVQEHAGVDKSCLHVKNDVHEIRCMSQGSTCTRLYTMVCKRDVEIKPNSVVEEAVWIPVDDLISKTNCGLLETSGWGVTPALGIDYFHIRPVLEVLHQVLSSEGNQTNSQEHVKPKSTSSGAMSLHEKIETAVTVDIAMDTRTNESEKRGSNVKLQVESIQRENVVHADQSSKRQKKRGQSGEMLSQIRAFMSDQVGKESPSRSPCQDQETQSNKENNIEVRVIQERVENDDCHNRNINTMPKPRTEDIIVIDSEDEAIPDSTTKKLCTRNRSVTNSRRQLTYNGQTQKELRASIRNNKQVTDTLVIKKEHTDEFVTTTKKQLAENKMESSNQAHTDIENTRNSDQYVDTTSKIQLTEPRENMKEGSMNNTGVNTSSKKQLPGRNIANGTEVSLKKLNHAIFDATSHEETTKGQKSDHITKPDVTLDNGRRIYAKESIRAPSVQQLQNKRKQLLQEVIDVTADYELHSACLQKDIIKCNAQINERLQESNGKDVFDDRDSLSKLRDPIQELDKFCLKNHWPRPNYSIQATPHKSTQYLYTATVQLCGVELEHSERGAASVDFQEAKQSAASTMLGRLYFFRARGMNTMCSTTL